MKLILKIGMVLLLTSYLVVVLGFIGKQSDAVLCEGMEIIVRDSLHRALVTKEDVENLVRLEHPEVSGMPVSSIDMSGIEDNLNKFSAIYDAQVYANVQGKLVVELSQRSPVVRIEDSQNQHYYLDAEGYVIPANLDYTPYVLYVNGAIPVRYRKEERVIGESQEDNILMEEILLIANFIHEDAFWKSQIVQVYVKRNGEFELIPRVGSQIIEFGSADRMEYKFFKLETLYRKGFSRTGWNQYGIINLKYNNQVICTKR